MIVLKIIIDGDDKNVDKDNCRIQFDYNITLFQSCYLFHI